jgi:hypothetical protein
MRTYGTRSQRNLLLLRTASGCSGKILASLTPRVYWLIHGIGEGQAAVAA